MPDDLGCKPPPVPGGEPLVSPEVQVDTGSVHSTVVVTPDGGVINTHLTRTPDEGSSQPKTHILGGSLGGLYGLC